MEQEWIVSAVPYGCTAMSAAACLEEVLAKGKAEERETRDFLASFIPELKPMIGFLQYNPYHAYDVFGHTVEALRQCTTKDLIVKLALFFHDFGKPHCYQEGEDGIRHFHGHAKKSEELAESIMRRIGFEEPVIKEVTQLVHYHDAVIGNTEKQVRKWIRKIGPGQFWRLLEIREADIKGQRPDYGEDRILYVEHLRQILETVCNEPKPFSRKELAVNGQDIMNITGMGQGPIIGEYLRKLKDKVQSGELENDRAALIRYIIWMMDCIHPRQL